MLWDSPAAMSTTLRPIHAFGLTRVGMLAGVTTKSPNCPPELRPQDQSDPSLSRAKLWLRPAAIFTTVFPVQLDGLATATGMTDPVPAPEPSTAPESPTFPQAQRLPSSRSARLWVYPAWMSRTMCPLHAVGAE